LIQTSYRIVFKLIMPVDDWFFWRSTPVAHPCIHQPLQNHTANANHYRKQNRVIEGKKHLKDRFAWF
jgi:hypothetical protein